MGIDGFIVGGKEPVPYQAKYRASNSLSWSELSTFAGLSAQFKERLVVTNTPSVSTVYSGTPGARSITRSAYDFLSEKDWQNLLDPCLSSEGGIKYEPYEVQEFALKQIVSYLRKKDNSRAQIKAACGIGKTFIGIWAYQRLRYNSAIVFVPSLALMSQTIKRWKDYFHDKEFSYLAICSDEDVGDDSYRMTVSEFPFEVTTSPSKIREFEAVKGRKVIFCTYHSSPLLRYYTKEIGVGIFDEAHWTACNLDSNYASALFDSCVKIKKRLFMTATRKIFKGNKKHKVLSMDDSGVYGPLLFDYSLRQGIDDGYLLPYKIIVMLLSEDDLPEYLINTSMTYIGGVDYRSDRVAAALGIQKAIEKGYVKKGLAFHNRIGSSKSFSELLPAINPEISSSHIDGRMPACNKSCVLSTLEKEGVSIVNNVRCLAEGVDSPNIDSSIFIDPKASLSDIIQIVGRAIRIGEGQEYGHVVLPIFVGKNELTDAAAVKSRFSVLWSVLNALMKEDPLLKSAVKKLKERPVPRARSGSGLEDLIEFEAPTIDLERMRPVISASVGLEYNGSWEKYIQLLKEFKEEHGHLQIPSSYDVPGLASWCSKIRTAHRRGLLPAAKVNQLNAIGFHWGKSTIWDGRLSEYMELFERMDGAIPHNKANSKLVTWAQKQRYEYKKGMLSSERANKLIKSGFPLNPSELSFMEKFRDCREFYLENGHCSIPDKKEYSAARSWLNRMKRKHKDGVLGEVWQKRLAKLEVI